MPKKDQEPSKVLVGVLMIAVVVVLAGTLISLNTLGEFDFSGSSLTGAGIVETGDFGSETTGEQTQISENSTSPNQN